MPIGELNSKNMGLLGGFSSKHTNKNTIHSVTPLNTIFNENYSSFNLNAFILTNYGQKISQGDTITTETY